MKVYVYGVTGEGTALPGDIEGVGAAPVDSISHRGLAAIVSPFDGDWVETTRANLSSHSHVGEIAMRLGTVLPIRFGVLIDDRGGVVDHLLEAQRAPFCRLLKQLNGQQEFRVQARYLPDAAVREAASRQPAIGRLQARVRGRPAAATYYERIRLGETVVETIEAIREQDSARLLKGLAPTATEHRVLDRGSDLMVLRAAFLVEGKRRRRFDDVVERLADVHESRMTLRVLGPLPPWDFVELGAG
jgi:hypothetical protein